MNWTKEQQEIIDIRGCNILVSAAAGSGKTAVLVERIKRILIDDDVPLSDILVVTFTNAAAAEMREKIVSAIPNKMHQIHKSHISTFHSFALDIIRRYFHAVDLSPGFHVCDEIKMALLQGEAMDQLFNEKFRDEDADFLRFLHNYGTGKSDEPVKDMILSVHKFIQSLPEPFAWLEDNVRALSGTADDFKMSPAYREMERKIKEELRISIATQSKILSMLDKAGISSLAGKALKDLEMLKKVQNGFSNNFDEGSCAVRSLYFETFRASKQEQDIYNLIKDDIQALRKNVKDSMHDLKSRFCAKTLDEYINDLASTYKDAKTLCQLVSDFDCLYKKKKNKQGFVDFSDIEHFALKILSNAEIAEEYRRKFQYIFIDEYQDSNLVQECLIDKIKRENNVFMVGDVKQSIYKFRLAEPEIFIDKYEKFKKEKDPNNIKLDLNRNFRSKGPVIEAVNEIFKRIMTDDTAGMDYDEKAALFKGVLYEGPLEHPVELHILDDRQTDQNGMDEEILEMKRAELEAFAAASIIKKCKGLHYYDEAAGKERQLDYKDMVILLRSIAGIGDIYYEILEKEGVPVYMDTGDGFFDTQEISVFLNLLKVIDNRKQDIPLLSVLRSPIFGFTIDSLAEIRLEHKKGPYHAAFFYYSENGRDECLRMKCRLALDLMHRWKQRSAFLPLNDFLWGLLTSSGYYNYAGALAGGRQRAGNLRALIDKASAYEAGRSKGLSGFISYVEAMKKGKIPMASVKLLGEGDDVVRIMTVHKSKGLEFPMVLAGNLSRRFYRGNTDQVSLHKQCGLALKYIDRNKCSWQRTILQDIIDYKRNQEDLAEEIRILYVSLTRSKDKLVLLGSLTDAEKALNKAALHKELDIVNGNSYMDFILPQLAESEKVNVVFHDRMDMSDVKMKSESNCHLDKESFNVGFDVEERHMLPVFDRLGWKYAFPMALETKSKYSVSLLSREMRGHIEDSGKRLYTVDHTKPRGFKEGAARGTAYHRLMEHIPFKLGRKGEKSIRTYALNMRNRGLITDHELGLIDYSEVAGFFDSPIGRRAAAAKKLYREMPFIFKKERNGEDIIVQGIIDCYFEENGEYVLLDYKSNFISEEKNGIVSLLKFYRPQMILYREALESIRGIRVKEMHLYLFSAGKDVVMAD